MSETFTTKQVAEHASVEKGLYIIVDNGVYKLDSFVDEHPGGAKILKRMGGKDASKQFWKVCTRNALPGREGGVGDFMDSGLTTGSSITTRAC
jgi:cytochrome b involved in lipid metabolism